MQIFEGILFFKATNNTKTNKLAAASWCFQKYVCEILEGLTHILLEAPNWQQLSDLFVIVLFVALQKRIPLKTVTLSCSV